MVVGLVEVGELTFEVVNVTNADGVRSMESGQLDGKLVAPVDRKQDARQGGGPFEFEGVDAGSRFRENLGA